MMHKNAQANLTHVHLNVMKHWQDSKSTPPPLPQQKLLIVKRLILAIKVLQHLLKCAFIPPHTSMVSTWMA